MSATQQNYQSAPAVELEPRATPLVGRWFITGARYHRERMRWTQVEVAREVATLMGAVFRPETLSHLEGLIRHRKNRAVTLVEAAAIAKVLGVPIGNLIDDGMTVSWGGTPGAASVEDEDTGDEDATPWGQTVAPVDVAETNHRAGELSAAERADEVIGTREPDTTGPPVVRNGRPGLIVSFGTDLVTHATTDTGDVLINADTLGANR